MGNNFNITWLATAQPARIQLVDDDITEVDVDSAVAIAENDDFLRLNSPDKQRAIQLLQRARLREKVARYRAERALTKYITKYGDIDPELLGLTDDEISDSETDE
jgi:selenocysteine-specific translation elongation factor